MMQTNGVHLNDTRLVANECRGIWLSKSRDQALSRSFGWKQDPSVTISQKDQRESNMAEYLKVRCRPLPPACLAPDACLVGTAVSS